MGRLLLVRHGQASWAADDYDVLSPTGWEQARVLGGAWAQRGTRPDVVVRGGLRRHRETTEALLEGAGLDLDVTEDRGWDEFDHLDVLAGMPAPPAETPIDKRAYQRLLETAIDAWMGAAGRYSESYAAFTDRVAGAFARVPADGTVAVVTSGGAVAGVCAALLADGDPAVAAHLWRRLNVVCVNTSVTKVVVGRRGRTLVTFNDHSHLDPHPELLTYR